MKHRQVLRPRLPSGRFGLQGAWDGKPRRREQSAVRPRQGPPFGGLSPEEFAALTPEEKIHVSNGGRVNE